MFDNAKFSMATKFFSIFIMCRASKSVVPAGNVCGVSTCTWMITVNCSIDLRLDLKLVKLTFYLAWTKKNLLGPSSGCKLYSKNIITVKSVQFVCQRYARFYVANYIFQLFCCQKQSRNIFKIHNSIYTTRTLHDLVTNFDIHNYEFWTDMHFLWFF